ncbi:MAG TPA: type I 3-dehydroquinate dehydratase [Thermoanaerobaculia bacterium]|nr:type I 3-dehydroquinate dehydratase [Thermoanaerobaculia bacterium]
MKLVVTIYEETCERALDAIHAVRREHDMIEVRAERFDTIDLHALRAATQKPIILTYRGQHVARSIVARAIDAAIDFIDVEWREGVEITVPERTVLSHHDYEGMRDVERIMKAMRARRCAYTKLAATPAHFADNERLLALLPSTVIGMGERGLYSRILAPFKGSELTFVAATNMAAPGQLTLERALEIFGRGALRADRVFAVAGNPAGHSLSPSIHNRLFREKGVPAAYTIASVERFAELTDAFLRGEPCGLSVTAPFKEEAFDFAVAKNADMGDNARRARAVNTLINFGDRILADNTDVDGFAALLPHATKAAVIGAGGTARAALVALQNANIPATVYNRTASKADQPLDALQHFDGDLIINTLPLGANVTIPPCENVIEAAYGAGQRGGLALLEAQAVRQHELFMKVFA